MSFIDFEVKGNSAYITLNRPDKMNSFNREMALELQSRLDECQDNDDIRAILLTGSGKGFCAGQDLGEAIGENAPPIDKIVREHYNPIIMKIRELKKPVICAVNGVAAGAGANLAFACDIVLSARSAAYIQAFSKIGLIPDSGGTYFLPRLLGPGKALALAMTADKLSAEDAEKYGLIYKVIDDENLQEEAGKLTDKLSQLPTKAFWLTKKLMNESWNNDLKTQLEMEEKLQAEAANSHDYNEGVNAFLEKRKPNYKGN